MHFQSTDFNALRTAVSSRHRPGRSLRRLVQAQLGSGGARERYRVGEGACSGRLFPRISRADVAHFMLKEFEQRGHLREVVPLCY
jgi:hypothetical protein